MCLLCLYSHWKPARLFKEMQAKSNQNWSGLKDEGNSLYKSHQYADAIIKYDRAIKSLQREFQDKKLPKALAAELAIMFSNRSAARYQLNVDKTGWCNIISIDICNTVVHLKF